MWTTRRQPQAGLALRDVSVRFGGLVALDGVSLRVPPGAVVGVIGPNGAGKTTLFNVICGLVRPDSGELFWDGEPLRPRPHRLTGFGIARTLQDVGLFDGLTVVENVMTGATVSAGAGFLAALFGLPNVDHDEHRIRTAALEQLDALGILEFAEDRPGTLPLAIRKRVALARALVSQPRLLLLDEPAGGLGAEEIGELADLIRGLPERSDGARSVLLVEHHMDLVMDVCDEIVVLDFGATIASGTPDQIRDAPPVVEAYLGTDATTVDQPDGWAMP